MLCWIGLRVFSVYHSSSTIVHSVIIVTIVVLEENDSRRVANAESRSRTASPTMNQDPYLEFKQ
jgi:hypothetical protein